MAKPKIAPNPNVGKNIEALMALRKEVGSQPLLAKRAGLAQSTIGRILRGEVNPSAENLKKIAEALDTNVDALFIQHDKMVYFRDARNRSKEGRFEDAARQPASIPVSGDIDLDSEAELAVVSLNADLGDLVGFEVDDGYSLRVVFDIQGVQSGKFLVFERKGLPAYSDLCLVHTTTGTSHLLEYLAEADDSYKFEDPVTGSRKTLAKSVVAEMHGVVAVASSRQWRP